MQNQTAQSISQSNRQNPRSRTKAISQECGRGSKKGFNTQKQWVGNAFLNSTFKPIAKIDVCEKQGRGVFEFENNLTDQTPEITYSQLKYCLNAYAKIKGVKVVEPINGTISDKIIWTIKTMDSLIPQGGGYGVNVEYNNWKGAHFVIYYEHYCWQQTVFIIPMQPVEMLREIIPAPLHKCLLDSISLLVYNASIPLFDEGSIDLALDMMTEEAQNHLDYTENEEEIESAKIEMEAVAEYTSDIAKWYLKMLRRRNLKKSNINRNLKRFNPKNGFEKSIVKLINETLSLVEPGENLHNYDYTTDSNGEEDQTINIDRFVTVGWNDEDLVTDFFIELLNADYSEFLANAPTSHMGVYPDTKKDLVISDWPQRFMNWNTEFHRILTTKI